MSTVAEHTVVETEQHAMRRLLAKARAEGIKLGQDAEGRHWASSASRDGHWYALTAYSCTCKGFLGHQRCKHLAALHAALGWLSDDTIIDPEPTRGPEIEVLHTEGGWVDDELTPAGMYRWVQPRSSIVVDGVETVRVSGQDRLSAVIFPGTERAVDVHVANTHYDTVVMWIRGVDPNANLDQLLGKAGLWPADEFMEETIKLVA